MIEIPILGQLKKYQFDNWLISKPIVVKVLDGEKIEFVLEDYQQDTSKEEFHQAIANFLAIDKTVLKQVQNDIYQYYTDVSNEIGAEDDYYIDIAKPEDVWSRIELNGPPLVTRRLHGDKLVYITLECNCDWEEEYGLQIVFKQGLFVNKIGPYDSHLTNSDAYDDPKLENVIYHY